MSDYFDRIDASADVNKTESGLRYEILAEGAGEQPGPQDTVKVHYEGRLEDGTLFDSSRKRGEPISFPVGAVIPGFAEGLQLLKPGGQARLHIPSEIGYGAQGAGGVIPPHATLVFEVELLEIQ